MNATTKQNRECQSCIYLLAFLLCGFDTTQPKNAIGMFGEQCTLLCRLSPIHRWWSPKPQHRYIFPCYDERVDFLSKSSLSGKSIHFFAGLSKVNRQLFCNPHRMLSFNIHQSHCIGIIIQRFEGKKTLEFKLRCIRSHQQLYVFN